MIPNTSKMNYGLIDSDRNIVIITSKIITSSHKLSYINHRSIYTHDQRLKDTVQTITSVKKYIPNAYIILIDNSIFTPLLFDELNKLVDCFINNKTDEMLNYYTDVNEIKATGEILQTLSGLDHLSNVNIKYNNIYKITGRYLVDKTFNISQYENNQNCFKQNLTDDFAREQKYYYTCFYKITSSYLETFKNNLRECFRLYTEDNTKQNDIYEVLLPEIMNFNFKLLPVLNIKQNISVWNDTSLI
jgi:hypothetical protein